MKVIVSSILCLVFSSCLHRHYEYLPGTVVQIDHPDSCSETGVVLGYYQHRIYLVQVDCSYMTYELWLDESLISIPEK